MLPLRVNADQNAVEFLAEFFASPVHSPVPAATARKGSGGSGAAARAHAVNAANADNTFFQNCQISTLRVQV